MCHIKPGCCCRWGKWWVGRPRVKGNSCWTGSFSPLALSPKSLAASGSCLAFFSDSHSSSLLGGRVRPVGVSCLWVSPRNWELCYSSRAAEWHFRALSLAARRTHLFPHPAITAALANCGFLGLLAEPTLHGSGCQSSDPALSPGRERVSCPESKCPAPGAVVVLW